MCKILASSVTPTHLHVSLQKTYKLLLVQQVMQVIVCVYMQVCKPICPISVMPFSSLCSSYRYILYYIYTVYGK